MVWKESTNTTSVGTAAKFGAFDINKISQLFNGNEDVDTVTINSPFTIQPGKLSLTSITGTGGELLLPEGPDTLVGRDTADTLTNKILEAPNLNSPLITSPTIEGYIHSPTHKDGGDDPIALDELAAPTDNTTLDATTDAHGLLPKLSGVANEFLNAEGLWVEHIMDIFTAEMHGLVPMTMDAPGNTFLRADATWAVPDFPPIFTATDPGLVPQTDDVTADNFLCADGTWTAPPISAPPPLFDDATDGLVPASGGGTDNFLRADGTWITPDYPTPPPVFDDVTDGLTPASGGGTDNFLRADGTWSTPPAGGTTANRQNPVFFNDVLVISNLQPWVSSLIATGTVVAATTGLMTMSHPGVLRIVSSTSANSGAGLWTDTAFYIDGGECAEFVFNITATSTIRLGFHTTTTSTDATDGCYIEIPTTRIAVAKCAKASVRTTSAAIAGTLATGTWYRALIKVNAAATSVDFSIYNDAGTLLGTQAVTTNIPLSTTGLRHSIVVTGPGGAATSLLHLDWLAAWWEGRALTR